MKRVALIKDGVVVNVAVFADDFNENTWDDCEAIESDIARVGGVYDGKNFQAPVKQTTSVKSLEERIKALEQTLEIGVIEIG